MDNSILNYSLQLTLQNLSSVEIFYFLPFPIIIPEYIGCNLIVNSFCSLFEQIYTSKSLVISSCSSFTGVFVSICKVLLFFENSGRGFATNR